MWSVSALTSRSTLNPTFSAYKVFARSTSETGTTTNSSFQSMVRLPFVWWVWHRLLGAYANSAQEPLPIRDYSKVGAMAAVVWRRRPCHNESAETPQPPNFREHHFPTLYLGFRS